MTFAKVWDGLWPIMIGAALALALRRWGASLPRIPEGDTVVAAEAAFKASFALSGFFESLDARLRQWPVSQPVASGDRPRSGRDGRVWRLNISPLGCREASRPTFDRPQA